MCALNEKYNVYQASGASFFLFSHLGSSERSQEDALAVALMASASSSGALKRPLPVGDPEPGTSEARGEENSEDEAAARGRENVRLVAGGPSV